MDINTLNDYISKLNNEQKQAATYGDGAVIVLAAAGSGKTSTLTARIAYLIVQKQIQPSEILAVTFTNKAAKEMISRLEKMGIRTKDLWIGTFHSLSNRILRQYANLAGLTRNFTIMDSQEQESFLKRTLRGYGYEPKNLDISDILFKINSNKEKAKRANQLDKTSLDYKYYSLYETSCLQDNCVDFAELLLGCYEIFQNYPEVADKFSNQFKHILVDEFQDTNELQYKWLKILSSTHKNIFAVGDDDQCLTEDALISVTHTLTKKISDIEIGENVLVKDKYGFKVSQVIQKYTKQVNNKFITLKCQNGIHIKSTAEHVHFVCKDIVEYPLNITHECELYGGMPNAIHKLTNISNNEISYNSNLGNFLFTYHKDSRPTENNLFYFAIFNNKKHYLTKAEDVQVGDYLFHKDLGSIQVESIERTEEELTVYDLDIRNYHNFFANGICTHNSIYSFRGAKPENIQLLKKDFNASLIKIEKNYRSDANILKAANAIIAKNSNRQGKNLVPTKKAETKLLMMNAFNDSEESNFIGSEIKRLRRSGIPYRNMAILYRTNSQSRSLEKSLTAYNIPYIIFGGFRFFDRQEVKHAMAYLRLHYNKDDNMAFLRVANTPARAIGDSTLKKLDILAKENNCSLYDALAHVDSKMQQKFQPFIETLQLIDDSCKKGNLADVVQNVIINSGLEYMYENDKKEGPERLDNLYELISAAKIFEVESQHKTTNSKIEEFLAFCSLESDVNTEKRDENADVVKLMTVHSSKGLEFEVVFLSGLEESLFPHSNSLKDDYLLEEERRLMYVAVTRAKNILYLTHSEERYLHGNKQMMVASRFLRDIPKELIDRYK